LHKVHHAPGQCLCQRVCKRTTGHCEVTAVKSLSFGVKSGEIFGFLGINGAGKTSTMNVLCGATAASSGAAYLLGCDVQTQRTEIRSQLGYCPQHDALIDLLTVREHLVLFARIKGIARSSLASVVEATLHEMNLGAFEHKLASQLSGGNKRKLSVAIATIAQPPLIILDEPSTGMDPQTRRCMWTVIQRLSNAGGGSCTVLLTTHSMEECEALCSPIGIMVSGRLRCLGTAQHIKNRFGRGYQLEISMKRCDAKGHVKMEEWVAQHFVGTHLLENHGSRMRFEIPSKEQTLADIFEQVEAVSSTGSLNIEHYSVSQTSLEQIFNSFASQQDQLKNATADGSSLDPDEADKDAWPPTVENLDPTEKPNLPARQLAREIHPHCPTESV
jgi:ABC-type multidrug transport system ATPase subunit